MTKNYILKFIFIATSFLLIGIQQLNAQVGIGTTNPSTKSSLDVSSTTTGVLIPRMTTAQRTAISPTLTDFGLKVYDITTSTFWFWNGTVWVQDATSISSWGLTGNSGTAPATNFVGTTDATDLVLKTNGIERMRINDAIGPTGTSGDISIGDTSSGTVKSNKELVLRQDGDFFGPSILRLRNRNGENGAIFETGATSPPLVDFIFKTGPTASRIVSNIRFETRAGSVKMSSNSTEWQFGQPDSTNGGPTLVIGAFGTGSNSSFRLGNLGIGTVSPNAKLHNVGTTAFTTATSGVNNTVILQNAGTFITPAAATTTSGLMYIIRNTSTTANLTVNNIIDYGSSIASNFALTPTIGSIMIVCDGTSWYRIK